MEGYKHIFDESDFYFNQIFKYNLTELLYNFRTHPVYWFANNGDNPPDNEAIDIAKRINPNLYEKYLEQVKMQKIVGFGDSIPNYGSYSELDSRHIMMSVILFTHLKEPVKNIVEIGGGYGNWYRINEKIQDFEKWFIIDLDFLNILQKWYLGLYETNKKYTILCNKDYSELNNHEIDLTIGSHSLSEFSFDIFKEYYENVVKKTKYLFYSYHKTQPSKDLIDLKLEIINQDFIPMFSISSENNCVENTLYVKKY